MWKKNTTNTTKDFLLDEETGTTAVWDGQSATIGGIIADKKIKYTKNDKIMAFLQVEDLLGSVEVIVFPKDYERHSAQLIEDNKVFIRGRVSVEEEKDGKLICERITGFDEISRKLWIKFPSKEAYEEAESGLFAQLAQSDGRDSVCIYVENPKAVKNLPPNRNVRADKELLEKLTALYGEENVKVT